MDGQFLRKYSICREKLAYETEFKLRLQFKLQLSLNPSQQGVPYSILVCYRYQLG